MKIAFLSCFDVTRVKKQAVWSHIAAHKPDVLIFLGDSIYMDFFPALALPKMFSSSYFLSYMYRLYKTTWETKAFRDLVTSIPNKFTTWDDHDFAWNNSCGNGSGFGGVPMEKKLIAKHLHLQFREFLETAKSIDPYPNAPLLKDIPNNIKCGINYSRTINLSETTNIKIIMTDSRYYRENADVKATLLGVAQKNWIEKEMASDESIKILCTGSTLSTDKDAWNTYSDYKWLTSKNFTNLIVLSGDIHINLAKQHTNNNGSKFYEFISSGAAAPPFLFKKSEGRWGLIEVKHSNKPNLSIDLYINGNVENHTSVDL